MTLPTSSSTESVEPEILEEPVSDKGEAPNATLKQTRLLLKAIPRRIDALLDSASRTVAQTALQTVLSWYPQVNLTRLQTVRDGAGDLLQRTYMEVNRLASTMAGWFSPYDYTPFLDDEGNPLSSSSMAFLADDSLHSSLRPYDAPSSQLARSSSDYRYDDSDLSDIGLSNTSPRAKHTKADSP